MKLTKIKINNFKSIEAIEFDIKKVGNSYTSILVGINESGKSNVLKAFSYLSTPMGSFDFESLSNQKNEDAEYVDFFYHLEFENKNTYFDAIKENIEFDKGFYFRIHNIVKNVFLKDDATEFKCKYDFSIDLPKEKLFFNKTPEGVFQILTENNESDSLEELTEDGFSTFFKDRIINVIKTYEPRVSYWTPSQDYLLSNVNLMEYKENISANKPLKNIFTLAGFKTNEKIIEQIDKLTNSQRRSKLISRLNETLNKYLAKVWKHNIDPVIDITETGMFSLSFKDKGEENRHDRFSINERSEGAQHFLSLILSLSLETKSDIRKNQLILIDEPEIHLHPSGIRDLATELLKIGEKNYVFVATHSPFLIDKNNKERHYIIKKNKKAITERKPIKDHENIIDDEVLREAFGLEVFKDLLNPHSLLVEGRSDKVILQKAFKVIDREDIGITNGHGSNIVTLASKLNHNDLSILVVVDGDKEGESYKQRILKIGGVYDENNVFTIRDLVGGSVDNSTIEDLLDQGFVESQFMSFYQNRFDDEATIEIIRERPFIGQITAYLKEHKKYKAFDMDLFKTQLANNFKPSKASLKTNNPLLNSLVGELVKKMKA